MDGILHDCARCGKSINTHSKFCERCGSGREKPGRKKRPVKNVKYPVIMVGVLVILMVFAFIIVIGLYSMLPGGTQVTATTTSSTSTTTSTTSSTLMQVKATVTTLPPSTSTSSSTTTSTQPDLIPLVYRDLTDCRNTIQGRLNTFFVEVSTEFLEKWEIDPKTMIRYSCDGSKIYHVKNVLHMISKSSIPGFETYRVMVSCGHSQPFDDLADCDDLEVVLDAQGMVEKKVDEEAITECGGLSECRGYTLYSCDGQESFGVGYNPIMCKQGKCIYRSAKKGASYKCGEGGCMEGLGCVLQGCMDRSGMKPANSSSFVVHSSNFGVTSHGYRFKVGGLEYHGLEARMLEDRADLLIITPSGNLINSSLSYSSNLTFDDVTFSLACLKAPDMVRIWAVKGGVVE
ncbi:hypothetical protein ACFLRF_06470 [Candidatus Altiarchaeota archaeon]